MNNAVRWHAPDLNAATGQSVAPALDDIDLASLETIVAEPAPPPLQPPTLEQIQAIRDAAQEEGFQQGHAEGYAQGQAEVRRLTPEVPAAGRRTARLAAQAFKIEPLA